MSGMVVFASPKKLAVSMISRFPTSSSQSASRVGSSKMLPWSSIFVKIAYVPGGTFM